MPFIHHRHLVLQNYDAQPRVVSICVQFLEAENFPVLVLAWPAYSPGSPGSSRWKAYSCLSFTWRTQGLENYSEFRVVNRLWEVLNVKMESVAQSQCPSDALTAGHVSVTSQVGSSFNTSSMHHAFLRVLTFSGSFLLNFRFFCLELSWMLNFTSRFS